LKRLGAGPADWLSQFEVLVIFVLAEILGAKQLLRANDVGALLRGAFSQSERFFEVSRRVAGTGVLQ
jgi:hypothetical protein